MAQIMRKRPSRFAYISTSGPKTGSRSTIAKHMKKMRRDKAAFEAKHPGNRMLTALGQQHREVKATIQRVRRRKVWVRGKS
jgi:hypothetical protein